MFGSDVADMALGMVFVYLLLSLTCSAVKELIEQEMKHRARDLETSLRELLADPDGTGPVQKIYNHGVIFGLSACRVSLGAPCWFEVLNKISVVRSTIKPQETQR